MTSPLRLLLIVWIAALSFYAQATAAAPAKGVQRHPHIEAELVPMSRWITPGSTAIVAIRQKIAPGWHTYWRNPGDSGGPTEAVWSLPDGFKADGFVWPRPERKALMGLMSYVYSGQVYLPVAIEVPAGLKAGSIQPISAEVLFLVCSDEMCIPVEMTLAADLEVGAGAAPLDPVHGASIEAVVTGAPRAAAIEARAALVDGRVVISAAGGPLSNLSPRQAYFFPYDQSVLDHAAAQKAELGPQGLTFSVVPGRATKAGLSERVSGIIATDVGAWEVTATAGQPIAGTTGKGLLSTEVSVSDVSGTGFLKAALFAFLGGLILNLMPCVFPVLAMKAAALTRSAHDPEGLRKDGMAFAAGVLLTFAVLAGILIGLRALGQGIGWGFQLQSPAVVAALALLMLAVAMNLSGVFHFGGRLQQLGQMGGQPSGVAGAFLTGVLAVVVAAPCTAPFMAVAIGAALLLDWPMALGIFLMLGAGLALPYVLISFSPRLLRGLPRPGRWMERLRNLLALPMYGTALWLGWVFARQTGNALLWLGVSAALLALGLWLYGRVQGGDARRGSRPGFGLGLGLVAVAFAGAAMIAMRTPVLAQGSGTHSALPSQPWSPQAVSQALAEGRPVVVNFTADWCVTCKINERTALSSDTTTRAFEEAGVVYLVGDWTRSDPAITAELQRHGRSGVPLYLVYRAGRSEPEILPQILTEGVVIKAVKQASRP
ncbi:MULTISPECIES: protein-disulfide reductase DsbD family protein [unclassified Brevundimonas]|uniref:protein-disulfide reductase DsbD family protein n=1 Tax=unclassified Brevundimonas TaxID=2622653 RepID=UPI0025BA289E|nr:MULTISPECIES: protein-disulfide reductase DsbD domain-containing protein [unclassified Brevundimonas]